jgi:hypothetical protein
VLVGATIQLGHNLRGDVAGSGDNQGTEPTEATFLLLKYGRISMTVTVSDIAILITVTIICCDRGFLKRI